MKQIIDEKQFDEERALYHLEDTCVQSCVFAGPEDGESVLKEARNIEVADCQFSLRYPMWHVKGFSMSGSTMDELTRAALWYADHGKIANSTLGGIKAVRECNDIQLENCEIISQEFGWKCSDITLSDSSITSEYIFLDSKNVKLNHVKMKGKYSFQYMENLEIIDCYCKDLKLINCTMEDTDLAFEYSDVDADVRGNVVSIKNPKSGKIIVDSVGEIIREDPVMECTGEVICRSI